MTVVSVAKQISGRYLRDRSQQTPLSGENLQILSRGPVKTLARSFQYVGSLLSNSYNRKTVGLPNTIEEAS